MKRKRITTGKKRFTSGRAVKVARKDPALSRINEHAAGIDIGAMSHFVSVPPASCASPVREFGVFTRDLYAIADWLKECGVRSVLPAFSDFLLIKLKQLHRLLERERVFLSIVAY